MQVNFCPTNDKTACRGPYQLVQHLTGSKLNETAWTIFQSALRTLGHWRFHKSIFKLPWSIDSSNLALVLDGCSDDAVNLGSERGHHEVVLYTQGNSPWLQQLQDLQPLLRLVLPALLFTNHRGSTKRIPCRRWGSTCDLQIPHWTRFEQAEQSSIWHLEHKRADRVQRDSKVCGVAFAAMGLFPQQTGARLVQRQVEAYKVAVQPLHQHDCWQLCQLCHLWVLQWQHIHAVVAAYLYDSQHMWLQRACQLREGAPSNLPGSRSLLQQSLGALVLQIWGQLDRSNHGASLERNDRNHIWHLIRLLHMYQSL